MTDNQGDCEVKKPLSLSQPVREEWSEVLLFPPLGSCSFQGLHLNMFLYSQGATVSGKQGCGNRFRQTNTQKTRGPS